jgi:alanine dehydrogenase
LENLANLIEEEKKTTQQAPTLKVTNKVFYPNQNVSGKLNTSSKVWTPNEVSFGLML